MWPLHIPDVGLLHGDRLCAVHAALLEELPVGARQQRRRAGPLLYTPTLSKQDLAAGEGEQVQAQALDQVARARPPRA